MREGTAPNSVDWFEIEVNDMRRANTFYEVVLGTEFSKLEGPSPPSDFEMWAFPIHQNAMGITAGALVRMSGLEAGRHNVRVFLLP